jgi:hypothetical protein
MEIFEGKNIRIQEGQALLVPFRKADIGED